MTEDDQHPGAERFKAAQVPWDALLPLPIRRHALIYRARETLGAPPLKALATFPPTLRTVLGKQEVLGCIVESDISKVNGGLTAFWPGANSGNCLKTAECISAWKRKRDQQKVAPPKLMVFLSSPRASCSSNMFFKFNIIAYFYFIQFSKDVCKTNQSRKESICDVTKISFR